MAKQKLKASERPSEMKQFRVILEDIDSKLDHVLDGHAALDKKIDDFRRELEEEISLLRVGQKALSENLEKFKVRMFGFERRMLGFERRTFSFEEKTDANFKSIFEYLKHIDREIQDLKRKLDQKADLERLERLEKRVAQVELVVKKYYGKSS